MDAQPLQPTPLHRSSPTDLVACSICLRVLRGSEWTDAVHVIRELRTYELASPPRLGSGICSVCASTIANRRARVDEQLRAA